MGRTKKQELPQSPSELFDEVSLWTLEEKVELFNLLKDNISTVANFKKSEGIKATEILASIHANGK